MAVPNPVPHDNSVHLDPALQRRLERLGLANKPGLWAERYLLCEQVVDPLSSSMRERFEATDRKSVV